MQLYVLLMLLIECLFGEIDVDSMIRPFWPNVLTKTFDICCLLAVSDDDVR